MARTGTIAGIELENELFDPRGGYTPYRGQCDKCMIAAECEKRKVESFTQLFTQVCRRRMIKKRPPPVEIEIPLPQPAHPCPHCHTVYSQDAIRNSRCGNCGAPIKGIDDEETGV